MNSVCVFCGARPGSNPDVEHLTRRLADTLAAHNTTLVYGGSSSGLMGTLADQVLAGGGQVIGVIPETLAGREIAHTGLTEQHIVNSMEQRKALMMELADAFIALPGGFGTLDELFETLTNAQLGLHTKPVALLNINGYYDQLLAFLDHAVHQGLLAPVNRERLIVASTPEQLFNRLQHASHG